MTAVTPGSETLIFRSPQELKVHLLAIVLANKQRLIGTEVEMFLLNEDGNPITQESGQKVFCALAANFEQQGLNPIFVKERTAYGSEKIVSLTIPGLGSINLEAGHQFEFAAETNQNVSQVKEKNTIALAAFESVAASINHSVIYTGYLPNYAERTEGVSRSRGRRWDWFYTECYGPDDARLLRKGQHGTASTQFTLDSGSDKFHEYWKALLLLEPILSFQYNGLERLSIIHNTYGSLIPTQVQPIVEAWNSATAEETVGYIVDRLLGLEVPFLPDPQNPGTYLAERLTSQHRPPTVLDLMKSGRLNEATLNNIGGFFYTGPAFRNFAHGLIEMRYIDSIGDAAQIADIAKIVMHFVYNDNARQQLLDYASFMTPERVRFLHRTAAMTDRRSALNARIADKSVRQIIDDVFRLYHQPPSFVASALVTTSQAPAKRGAAGANTEHPTAVRALRPFMRTQSPETPFIPGTRHRRPPEPMRLAV